MFDNRLNNTKQENKRCIKIRVPNIFNIGQILEVDLTFGLFFGFCIVTVLIYVGIYMDKMGIYNLQDLFWLLKSPISIGEIMVFFGIGIAGMMYLWIVRSSKEVPKEKDFIDVDDEANEAKSLKIMKEMEKLKEEISILKQNNEVGQGPLRIVAPDEIDSFSSYMGDLKQSIEDRIQNLDKKASLMLDKGTNYARYGIAFYVLSIIIWQWWISNRVGGISKEHIIGMVSCSILFLFVEFLSAWFMKQYQHFINTSTYLTKIKSIFDKYMLSYLALKELSQDGQVQNEHVNKILDAVSQDIKWPDTNFIYDKRDISFAKEAIESLSSVYKELVNLKTGNIKN